MSFESHFQDAFTTPQMPSYTPRQPDVATMTPIQAQQSTSDMLRANYYAHMQASGGASSSQAMPPPSQAGYQPQMTSPVYANGQVMSAHPGQMMAYDTTQMQTPPPTRGTHVKRPQPQQIAFGTPSTIASRRIATPQQGPLHETNTPAHMAAGMQFPQLQFSPDVYQFGNFGPASAPVYPQTQLLWDQTTSPQMYQHQQPPRPTLDDPFAPASSPQMQWPAGTMPPNMQSSAPPVSFNTPAMASFPVQAAVQRPSSAVQLGSAPAPPMTTASVDPSLVYSSPIRPVRPQQPAAVEQTQKPRSTTKKSATNRKDSGTGQQKPPKPEHKRSETVATADSISTVATASSQASTSTAPRPPLHRSNTTGTTRPQLAQSALSRDTPIKSSSINQVPRTASPLKRIGVSKSLLGSISEFRSTHEARNSRPKVVLTVDENGRARVVRPDAPRPEDSPTQAIRSRYPGLFDSDSSDAESEEEKETPSRASSFSFARGEERYPKAAKLDPPIENLDGLTIPRSSSSASMKVTPSRAAIAAAAQLRRGGSLRKKTPSRSGSRRVASSAAPSIDTAPMDVAQDRRQSIIGSEDFTRGLDLSSAGDLDAHNRRWSIMSMEQQQSISPTHMQGPRFLELHRPSQHRQVRCTCGVNSDHGQMVQCKSCTQWCHAACIGVDPTAGPITCFLCTKPTTRLSIGTAIHRKRS